MQRLVGDFQLLAICFWAGIWCETCGSVEYLPFTGGLLNLFHMCHFCGACSCERLILWIVWFASMRKLVSSNLRVLNASAIDSGGGFYCEGAARHGNS